MPHDDRNTIYVRRHRSGGWMSSESPKVCSLFLTKQYAVNYAEHRAKLTPHLRVVIEDDDGDELVSAVSTHETRP